MKAIYNSVKSCSSLRYHFLAFLFFLCFSFSINGQTVEFTFTGSAQTYTVPAGVSSIKLQVYGAQGGGSEDCDGAIQDHGGLGGYAEGVISVTPGQVLNIYVGGKPATVFEGVSPGGYNGGGSADHYGGGGGGGTDIRINGTSVDNRVIVAGGGGGGNTGCPDHGTGGGGGGLQGNNGTSNFDLIPGGGGTQTMGGAAGTNGKNGSLFQGAMGDSYHIAGGGGGYYGGGSAYAAGAGGGSSYIGGVTSGYTEAAVRTGNGLAKITILKSIITSPLAKSSFCTEESFSFSFNVDGFTPNAGNIYTAQLSDAAGSFASPISIGELISTALSGTINAAIPAGVARGSGYRVRVISSSPVVTGSDNGTNLAIKFPGAVLSGGAVICPGESAKLRIDLVGVAPWNVTYTDGANPVTITANASPYTLAVSPASETIYSLTAVSDANCTGGSFSGEATVSINEAPLVTVPVIATVSAGVESCGATVSFEATATGTPAPAISYSILVEEVAQAISSPYFFPVGTTTVTATATNSCGSDVETFTVTVADNEAPHVVSYGGSIEVIKAAYVTSNGGEPWGSLSNEEALSTAFGADNWDKVFFETVDPATLFNTDYQLIFIEGGSQNANEMETFVDANIATIESWVAAGNSLFLNAAPNEGEGMNWGFGGVQLVYPNSISDVTGIDPDHPIWGGPFTPTAFNMSGGAYAHATVISNNPAAVPVIVDKNDPSKIVLQEMSWGAGTVFFGGMTMSSFHSPKPEAENIRPNMLSYLGEKVVNSITLELDVNGNASITAGDVDNGSYDNCGIASMQISQTSFDCNHIGRNEVTLTVTDIYGNAATGTAVVTVVDKIAPVVSANEAYIISLNAEGTGTFSEADMSTVEISDACGIKSQVLGKTSFSCSDIAASPVQVTLTVTDNNNNVTTKTVAVTIEDKTAPVVSVKAAHTIQLDASGAATLAVADILTAASADACGIKSEVLNKISFNCSDIAASPVQVTLTVTDNNNNVTTKTVAVTVEDKVAPSLTVQDVRLVLNEEGSTVLTEAAAVVSKSDNCAAPVITFSQSVFGCESTGDPVAVTVTATDASGNTTDKVVNVTVVDETAPVAIAKNITLELDANGEAVLTAAAVDNGSSDNCSIAGMSIDRTSFSCVDAGEHTVTLTVTDHAGLMATATAVVTVVDVIAPVMENCPADFAVVLRVAETYVVPDFTDQITVSDNCATSGSVSQFPAAGTELSSLGTHVVQLKTVDASGNEGVCSFIITLEHSNTAPAGLSLSASSLEENQAEGVLVGRFGTEDVDGEDAHTYALISGEGSDDNADFYIEGNALYSALSFDYEVKKSHTIRVVTLDAEGERFEKTFTIQVIDIEDARVFIPNLFSPNNDGSNDTFRVRANGIQQISFRIFNRMGVLVYETSNVQQATETGWDGTYKGKEQPSGSYVWQITGKFSDGAAVQFDGKSTGNITLIR